MPLVYGTRWNSACKRQNQHFGTDSWLQPPPFSFSPSPITPKNQTKPNRSIRRVARNHQVKSNFMRGIYLSIAAYRCLSSAHICVLSKQKSCISEQPNNENCCLFFTRIYDPMSTARTVFMLEAQLLLSTIPSLLRSAISDSPFQAFRLNRSSVKSERPRKVAVRWPLDPSHRVGLAANSRRGSQLQNPKCTRTNFS